MDDGERLLLMVTGAYAGCWALVALALHGLYNMF